MPGVPSSFPSKATKKRLPKKKIDPYSLIPGSSQLKQPGRAHFPFLGIETIRGDDARLFDLPDAGPPFSESLTTHFAEGV